MASHSETVRRRYNKHIQISEEDIFLLQIPIRQSTSSIRVMSLSISDQEIDSAWAELSQKDDPKINFLIISVDGNKAVLSEQGDGGIDKVRELFDDSKIQFCVLRVEALDVKKNVTSKRAKFIYITWVGPQVGILKKARAFIYSADIKKKFPAVQLSVELHKREELEAVDLAKEFLRVGGAHKPTCYKFGPDVEIQVEDLS